MTIFQEQERRCMKMVKFFKDGGLFLLLYLGPALILGTIVVPINWISYQLTGKLVWK